jgi:hypothetical protein
LDSYDCPIKWELRKKLEDIEAEQGRTLFIASCFNLPEIAGIQQNFGDHITNSQGKTPFQVAVAHGNYEVISVLVNDKRVPIGELVVKAAAAAERFGKEIMDGFMGID